MLPAQSAPSTERISLIITLSLLLYEKRRKTVIFFYTSDAAAGRETGKQLAVDHHSDVSSATTAVAAGTGFRETVAAARKAFSSS